MSTLQSAAHISSRFDIWDSVPLRVLMERARAGSKCVLFAERGERPLHCSNVNVPYQLSRDVSSSVNRLHTRVNFEPSAERQSWLETTVATVIQGAMPVMRGALTQFGIDQPVCLRPEFHSSETRAVAAMLASGVGVSFHDLPSDGEVAQYWLTIAANARKIAGTSYSFVVPPRQTIRVEIETCPRALGALLERMTPVAPEALLWFHFIGSFLQERFTS